jgi:hypothetical protein
VLQPIPALRTVNTVHRTIFATIQTAAIPKRVAYQMGLS